MIFYIDDYLTLKKEYSYEELISTFIKSGEPYDLFLNGEPFESCFIKELPGIPVDIVITSEQWNSLKKEYQNQTLNTKFK